MAVPSLCTVSLFAWKRYLLNPAALALCLPGSLESLAPTVGESHIAERPARGSSELPERIAQWDQRRGFDVGRNAEQLFYLRVAELVNGRNATADAEGTRRQHDVLDGRIDRRSRRDRILNAGIERDARQDEHGRLTHVLAQVSGGSEHLPGWAVGRRLGRGGVGGYFHQFVPRFAIEFAETFALGRVADEHEAPPLAVATARSADGRVHDLPQHSFGNRIGLEPTYGSLRGRDFEELHGSSRDGQGLHRRRRRPAKKRLRRA